MRLILSKLSLDVAPADDTRSRRQANHHGNNCRTAKVKRESRWWTTQPLLHCFPLCSFLPLFHVTTARCLVAMSSDGASCSARALDCFACVSRSSRCFNNKGTLSFSVPPWNLLLPCFGQETRCQFIPCALQRDDVILKTRYFFAGNPYQLRQRRRELAGVHVRPERKHQFGRNQRGIGGHGCSRIQD